MDQEILKVFFYDVRCAVVTNQNRHWNHHRWRATNSLERTQFSCWCL